MVKSVIMLHLETWSTAISWTHCIGCILAGYCSGIYPLHWGQYMTTLFAFLSFVMIVCYAYVEW